MRTAESEASSELTLIGDATPYVYFGDSHSTIGNLVLRTADGGLIATPTAHIWRFVAQDMLDEDGLVSEAVMQVLRRFVAFHARASNPALPGLRPVHTTYDNRKELENLGVTEVSRERAYILTVGEINARYLLQQFVADEIDFEVPFDCRGIERLSSWNPRKVIGAKAMLQLLADKFSRLFVGLRVLREAGLRTLFLHGVPPPATDDADAKRVLQHDSPGQLRYRLAMYINFLYREVCRDLGVGFIDTWNLVTEGNVLRPEFYLDGLHLNQRHAVLSVTEVHRRIHAKG